MRHPHRTEAVKGIHRLYPLFSLILVFTLTACGGSSGESTNSAPVANASGDYSGTVGVAVSFDSSGSSDTDGSIVGYLWAFGDGNSSTDANPTYTYANAGSYTVTLTVSDNDGATHSDTATATITDPANVAPTANANGPYSAQTGEAINFSSAGSADSDGSITTYAWDFGDGATSSNANPAHIYTAAGSFTVSLTVTDNDGASHTDTTSATITNPPGGNQTPTANANGPYTGTTGIAVVFSSTGSSDPDGTITTYAWNFGDGNTSSAANPSHTYAAAGTYNVSLTVTDNGGAIDSDVTTATISDPPNVAPTANANGDYAGTAGVAVSFSSAGSSDSDGSIASYAWDFGDGGSSTQANPNHSYASAGSYTVTLTVTDNDGATDSDTATATISAAANVSPTANANGDYTGTTGNPVSFFSTGSSDSDGAITGYQWDFGDGANSTDANPVHTYAAAGNYTVTLTVTDDEGATDSDTASAAITDTPTIPNVSINSTSQNGALSMTPVTEQALDGQAGYKIFAVNDLGMHCGDFDTRVSSILPPFNVLHATVIQRGATPTVLTRTDNVEVYYSSSSNPNDPILTGVNSAGTGPVYSSIAGGNVFKTNFWDIARDAYDPFYPAGILPAFYPAGPVADILDLGLPMPNVERLYLGDGMLTADQQSMPGRHGPYVDNAVEKFEAYVVDQPFFTNPAFKFGYVSEDVNWYEAPGIPLAAFDDAGRENPWPLFRIQAKQTGTTLASVDTVVPISGEANCGACHGSPLDGGNGSATATLVDNSIAVADVLDDPEHGNVPLEVSKEYAADLNLLRLHDHKHGTTLEANKPVVCQQCHYTPALDLAQLGPLDSTSGGNGREQTSVKSMSNVMHSHHGTVRDTNGDLLFPEMPAAIKDNLGFVSNDAERRAVLDETCYQCHPGRRTDCLRGAMANGGMLCQDCHGNMAQVGDDFTRNVSPTNVGAFELGGDFYTNPAQPRVPWANEPGCGSCHTGDAMNNMASDANVVVNPADADGNLDSIRLFQAYKSNDAKATPIVPTNKRFAENVIEATNPVITDPSDVRIGNPMLYRVSTGHGGIFCETCHGSTHGIWPNKNDLANDNVAANQLQGHKGTIIECDTCHTGSLGNTLEGPHGMHPVGDTSFADGGHASPAENNPNACRACHGDNGQGTVLSRMATDRTLQCDNSTSFCPDGNSVLFPKAHMVGCTECHGNEL